MTQQMGFVKTMEESRLKVVHLGVQLMCNALDAFCQVHDLNSEEVCAILSTLVGEYVNAMSDGDEECRDALLRTLDKGARYIFSVRDKSESLEDG